MKNDGLEMEQITEVLEKFSIEAERKLLAYSKINTEEAVHRTVKELKSVIKEIVADELSAYGIDPSSRPEFNADLRHLRMWRKRIEDLSTKIGNAIVMAILAGAIALLMAGYKTMK